MFNFGKARQSISFIKGTNTATDYQRNDISVNVIPADTKNKKPEVPWLEQQDKPIFEWQYGCNFLLLLIKEHEKSGGYS
jgi:hypothetical protein